MLILPRIAHGRKCAMRKKEKSKRTPVPAIPQLSLEVLDDVQKIERYARQELRDCEHTGHFNRYKAERILRTCTVQVLKVQLDYYESLPTFHEKWVIKLQENTIEAGVGMLPDGYSDELYQDFRNLLWDTTYKDLNPPKKLAAKTEEPQKPDMALAIQIKDLRDECRLTTEELAEKISLDSRSVQRHIAGKTQPYVRHIRAYEALFSKLLDRKVLFKKL
jgi:hypothetical protein